MSLLAETCALLHDSAAAAVLYPRLVPYAALNTLDPKSGARGSVARATKVSSLRPSDGKKRRPGTSTRRSR
jgi:hypothetical protein